MTEVREQLQQTLGAAYTLERELGGGGMSRVFVAQETALGRTVVVKLIAPEQAQELSAERFAREVRLAARLQQANIVPLLAAGSASGVPYYTMPFVKGESLRARLSNGVLLSFADAVSILRDVARALAYAHGEGVVHRDIKPENVLLSGGAAVVTDFGIAKALSVSRTEQGGATTLTQAGASLGTPAYMAPEQAAGDPNVDHRADLYAWGVMAWELLGGEHPFASRTTAQAMVVAQLAEPAPSLRAKRPVVPEVLETVVMQCLAKAPAERPESAAALLAALDSTDSSRERVAPRASTRTRARGLVVAGVIVLAAAALWFGRGIFAGRGIAGTGKSLAVLPFLSENGDTTNAYLAEGIADEVNNTLSQVPGLRLAGRRSAARFAGQKATAQDIGSALQVGDVLDGTVRRAGDRIRVTAELLNARDGGVVWHENYERPAKDVLAVQDEIARAIAGQLQVTLSGAGLGTVARSGTRDAAAYDLYLKGMYLYRRRGPDIADAISTLEQATTRDSTFARAWAALATALTVSPSYSNVRAGDVLPRARAAAKRAVRLDSTLSDAHAALGYVHAEMFDWSAADSELRRAIALDPNNAEPHYRLAYSLMNQGRAADAIPELQRARADDPRYFLTASYLGWAESEVGREAEGLDEARRGLALEPGNIAALSILATVYNRAALPDSARVYAHRVVAVSSQPARLGVAASVLARNGDRPGAEELVRQLEATPAGTWTRWTGLALAYTGLGDTARALTALEHAAAGDGDALPTYYKVGVLDQLPPGPRLDTVLRRYRLDPARVAARRRAVRP